MNLSLKRIALVFLLFYIPVQSFAWAQLGHRIVGEIADSYLKTKTRKEIKKILGNESVAMASTWADFIKSESSYKYLDNWHYFNLPAGLDQNNFFLFLKNDTTINAYSRIKFLSAELKNKNLADDKKTMYLRLLIHLVGDIHQPLHTGRKDDLGGNTIKLTWFGQPSNLHRVWDDDLIESQELSYTEYAKWINFSTAEQRNMLQHQDISQWVYDSYQISEKVYAVTKPEYKLGYRYIYDHIQTANEQLLKGGIHLAGLLNEIFS
jgi:hypothetical protein